MAPAPTTTSRQACTLRSSLGCTRSPKEGHLIPVACRQPTSPWSSCTTTAGENWHWLLSLTLLSVNVTVPEEKMQPTTSSKFKEVYFLECVVFFFFKRYIHKNTKNKGFQWVLTKQLHLKSELCISLKSKNTCACKHFLLVIYLSLFMVLFVLPCFWFVTSLFSTI